MSGCAVTPAKAEVQVPLKAITVIIDLHVHTRRYSACSSIDPSDLIPRALEVGLDGLVLTEHGILWRQEKIAPLQEEAAKHGLLILAGQEISCFHGGRRKDFLVFGIDTSLGSAGTPEELIDLVHDQGGLVVAAHPFKPSRLGVGYHGAGDEIRSLNLDAVELYHPDHDEQAREKVRSAAEELGIPMTGGGDAHELYHLGSNSTRFLNRVSTVDDLVNEIREGRVEPLNGAPK